MAWLLSDTLEPNFDGPLIENRFVKSGLFVVKTAVQRNTVLKSLYRQLDGSTTTLCFVSAENAMYELIANPSTEGTTDQDWKKLDFGVSDILITQGTWDADNTTPALDDAAAIANGNDFYIVTGAVTPIQVQFPDLFQGQQVTVKDGDWIISNGTYWFVSAAPINWDSISGIPQTILDYVGGTVIAHPHEIVDVNGLQAALDLKFDISNVADNTIDYSIVPNEKLIDKLVLDTNFYNKTETFTQTEVTNLIDAVSKLTTKGDLLGFTGAVYGRLSVGPNDQILVSDDTQPLGFKWQDPVVVAEGVPEAPTDGKQYGRQSTAWTEIEINPEEPFIDYYVSATGNDGTAEAGNKNLPWELVSAASIAAKADKDTTNNNNRVYILAGGSIKDFEINRSGIPIFAEDFSVVWTDQSSRAVISDRTLGENAIIDVSGKGTFVHTNPNSASNQGGINLRGDAPSGIIQAKLIDYAKVYGIFTPQIEITDCQIMVGLSVNQGHGADIILRRCLIRYGLIASADNVAICHTLVDDCVIVSENAYDVIVTDKEGNTVTTVVLTDLIVDRLIDSHAWRAPVTGNSGGGNVSIASVNYAITFNTDLETTVDDFVDTHTAALLATADQVISKRWKEITLAGTSGTSTITLAGTPYLATFNTDINTTLADFITSHESAINTQGYRVEQFNDILAFSKNSEAVFTLTVANTSGDLDGTISYEIYLGSAYDNYVRATFANTSGDLDVTFDDYYTATELQNKISDSGVINEYGYSGFYLQNSSGNFGRGNSWTILNSVFLLRKNKSIGLKIVFRVEELDGSYAGIIFRDCRIQNDGGLPNIAGIIYGKDDALSNPAELDIYSTANDAQSPYTGIISTSGYSAPVVRSNDPSINNVQTGGGSEYDALGTFVPLMPFTSNGDYNPLTLVADIVIDTSSIVVGKFRNLQIIQSAGQSFEIDLGSDILHIDGVDPLVEGAFILLPGTYQIRMISSASTGTLGIEMSVVEGQLVIQTPPTMSSLVVAADNLTCELFFSEATFANDDATGDLQLADFGTATLTGGTATAPVLTNPVHSAGDSSIVFDLAFTGTPDGAEVLEIPVADGNSIFDAVGNPMDSGESATDNLNADFLPTDLTELLIWLDATTIGSDGSVVDGGNNLTTWADKSGNNLDFDGTGHAPLWDTVDKITFDAVAEQLDGDANIASIVANNTGDVFIVGNIGSSAIRWFNVSDATTTSKFSSILTQENGAAASNNRQIDFLTATANSVRKLSTNEDNNRVLIHVSSNGSRYKIFINGTDQDPLEVTQGSDDGKWFDDLVTPDTVRIGQIVQSSGEVFYPVVISEFIMTDAELSSVDRIKLEDYLIAKYTL